MRKQELELPKCNSFAGVDYKSHRIGMHLLGSIAKANGYRVRLSCLVWSICPFEDECETEPLFGGWARCNSVLTLLGIGMQLGLIRISG